MVHGYEKVQVEVGLRISLRDKDGKLGRWKTEKGMGMCLKSYIGRYVYFLSY